MVVAGGMKVSQQHELRRAKKSDCGGQPWAVVPGGGWWLEIRGGCC